MINSYEKIYKENKDKLFYRAYMYLKDYYEAQDVVNEIFTNIIKNKADFENFTDREITNYLYRSVYNRSVSLYKKKSREQPYPPEIMDSYSDSGTEYLYDKICEEVNEEYFSPIKNNLSPLNAKIMHMYLVEQMTMEEIAADLKMTKEAVKKRIYRGKAKITKLLLEK